MGRENDAKVNNLNAKPTNGNVNKKEHVRNGISGITWFEFSGGGEYGTMEFDGVTRDGHVTAQSQD